MTHGAIIVQVDDDGTRQMVEIDSCLSLEGTNRISSTSGKTFPKYGIPFVVPPRGLFEGEFEAHPVQTDLRKLVWNMGMMLTHKMLHAGVFEEELSGNADTDGLETVIVVELSDGRTC